MVRISDIIRSDKTDVEVSPWRTGHIARASFPLSKVKSKRYKLGPEYRWRIVKFKSKGREFRVLIELNENKEIFRATLGAVIEEDIAVLCCHEFHKSEPGWHCHVSWRDIDTLTTGAFRSNLVRWPRAELVATETAFPASATNALSLATNRFRIAVQGELL